MMGSDDGARIWSLNYRLSTLTLGEATPGIEALGIEAKEFFVLDGVADLTYPAAIADRLSMSRPTITLHVRNLERKRLVTRAMDPTDLRRHRLTLTAKGIDVVRDARRVVSQAYATRLGRLNDAERGRFEGLLAKLVS